MQSGVKVIQEMYRLDYGLKDRSLHPEFFYLEAQRTKS